MKAHPGLDMLEIQSEVMGKPVTVYPCLIWDDKDAILVDAAYPGQLPLIQQELTCAAMPFEKLNMLILTHHDIDHIGCLADIQKESAGRVKTIAHELEKPFIAGEKQPLKLAQLEARLDTLPEEMKTFYENLKTGYQICIATVQQSLIGDEELPYCGGIQVVFSPGHSPGHISLYLKRYKTLIAGDALVVENGMLVPTPAYLNHNMDQYSQSLLNLMKYDIQSIICYHGGLYCKQVNQRIASLALATPFDELRERSTG